MKAEAFGLVAVSSGQILPNRREQVVNGGKNCPGISTREKYCGRRLLMRVDRLCVLEDLDSQ
jgi:hypothetical protein